MCSAAAAWSMYSVPTSVPTSSPRFHRTLDPTSKNAPRRAGLFLLCASQLERPSRVGFVPFFHRHVSHTCSQASWSKSRPDRCAGMLEGMRACVRLASRTRFGVAHAHGICTNAPLSSQKGGGPGNCPPAFFQRHYQRLDVAKLSARRGRRGCFAGPARLPE